MVKYMLQCCLLENQSSEPGITIRSISWFSTPGGGHSLIWAIRGRVAGQGMVFWPRCPKQGIQFDLSLS